MAEHLLFTMILPSTRHKNKNLVNFPGDQLKNYGRMISAQKGQICRKKNVNQDKPNVIENPATTQSGYFRINHVRMTILSGSNLRNLILIY